MQRTENIVARLLRWRKREEYIKSLDRWDGCCCQHPGMNQFMRWYDHSYINYKTFWPEDCDESEFYLNIKASFLRRLEHNLMAANSYTTEGYVYQWYHRQRRRRWGIRRERSLLVIWCETRPGVLVRSPTNIITALYFTISGNVLLFPREEYEYLQSVLCEMVERSEHKI